MHSVATFLDGLALGSPVGSDGLTMFPLIGRESHEPNYVTLNETVAGGSRPEATVAPAPPRHSVR